MDSPIILPEVRWTWRRCFSFLRTLLFSALLVIIILKLPTAAATAATPMQWLGLALVAALIVDALLYLAGATATDITRLTAAARTGAAPPGEAP